MSDKIDNNNIPHVDPKDFEFAHSDSFGKIKDEKFQTKSTTFAKDAFKRFCKNKSSVAGAIIIAILMLGSIFGPIISPYNTTDTQPIETYKLLPKIFESGTGWWDGCRNQSAVLKYNGEEYVPSGTEYDHLTAIVSDYTYSEVEYRDVAADNLIGGTLRLSARDVLEAGSTEVKSFFYRNYTHFSLTSTDGYEVSILMGDKNNIKENYELTEYRVDLEIYKTKTAKTAATTLPLYPSNSEEWSKEYFCDEEDPLVLDLSQCLEDNDIESADYCRLVIRGKYLPEKNGYFLIKGVNFTADDEELTEEISQIDIVDCNYTSLRKMGDVDLWQSSGETNIYQAEYAKVTYRYDMYEHQLGFSAGYTIGKSLMDEYIAKGWCEYDYNIGPTSFKLLSDKCPICADEDGVYVLSQESTAYEGKIIVQMTANVQIYKVLGYSSMPKYVFGTDASGRACLTHCLRCLKNSLLISIICCAICIAIGIVWGSISGYYGGKVDLIMERISDILSGIPSTVVLTLMLLILGRTTLTFAFAICLTGWIGTASLTRTQFYRFKNREHVLAARTLGARDSRLIFKHILPNSLGTIVTSCVLNIPAFIFTEASLAFLHLGLDSGDSFGVILSDNQTYLSTFPCLVLVPSVILCLLMISFNLFGNGLRDALNPTLKGGEQ